MNKRLLLIISKPGGWKEEQISSTSSWKVCKPNKLAESRMGKKAGLIFERFR